MVGFIDHPGQQRSLSGNQQPLYRGDRKIKTDKSGINIYHAEYAGFCFGVKRAIQLATRTVDEGPKAVYSIGPLIHNPQEVERLSLRGVQIISSPDDVDKGVVIIRSHGIAPDFMQHLVDKGLEIIDATCPFVKNAHDIALMLEVRGYPLVIIGEPNHPEISSLVDSLRRKSWVIDDLDEIAAIPDQEKIGIIAQTTQSVSRFRDAIIRLLPKAKELAVYNTICNATTRRQNSTFSLARQVDLMLVVGGKNSANTARLQEISQACGVESHLIETAAEIKPEWLRDRKNIGITAGASTPDWIIELVHERVTEIAEAG